MMEEGIEQELAQLVDSLSPGQYQRFGPALQEVGLALAELRQVQRTYSDAMGALRQALKDLDHAEERARHALRLLEGSDE